LFDSMFPAFELKEGQGAIMIQPAFVGFGEPYSLGTGPTAVSNNIGYGAFGPSPGVGSSEQAIPYETLETEPLYSPTTGVSSGTVSNEKGVTSIVFLRQNDPHWHPTMATPIRVYQLTDAPPAIWGEVYLTERRESVDGIEYCGAVMNGHFQYPYRLTINGTNFFEARRWSRFIKGAN